MAECFEEEKEKREDGERKKKFLPCEKDRTKKEGKKKIDGQQGKKRRMETLSSNIKRKNRHLRCFNISVLCLFIVCAYARLFSLSNMFVALFCGCMNASYSNFKSRVYKMSKRDVEGRLSASYDSNEDEAEFEKKANEAGAFDNPFMNFKLARNKVEQSNVHLVSLDPGPVISSARGGKQGKKESIQTNRKKNKTLTKKVPSSIGKSFLTAYNEVTQLLRSCVTQLTRGFRSSSYKEQKRKEEEKRTTEEKVEKKEEKKTITIEEEQIKKKEEKGKTEKEKKLEEEGLIAKDVSEDDMQDNVAVEFNDDNISEMLDDESIPTSIQRSEIIKHRAEFLSKNMLKRGKKGDAATAAFYRKLFVSFIGPARPGNTIWETIVLLFVNLPNKIFSIMLYNHIIHFSYWCLYALLGIGFMKTFLGVLLGITVAASVYFWVSHAIYNKYYQFYLWKYSEDYSMHRTIGAPGTSFAELAIRGLLFPMHSDPYFLAYITGVRPKELSFIWKDGYIIGILKFIVWTLSSITNIMTFSFGIVYTRLLSEMEVVIPVLGYFDICEYVLYIVYPMAQNIGKLLPNDISYFIYTMFIFIANTIVGNSVIYLLASLIRLTFYDILYLLKSSYNRYCQKHGPPSDPELSAEAGKGVPAILKALAAIKRQGLVSQYVKDLANVELAYFKIHGKLSDLKIREEEQEDILDLSKKYGKLAGGIVEQLLDYRPWSSWTPDNVVSKMRNAYVWSTEIRVLLYLYWKYSAWCIHKKMQLERQNNNSNHTNIPEGSDEYFEKLFPDNTKLAELIKEIESIFETDVGASIDEYVKFTSEVSAAYTQNKPFSISKAKAKKIVRIAVLDDIMWMWKRFHKWSNYMSCKGLFKKEINHAIIEEAIENQPDLVNGRAGQPQINLLRKLALFIQAVQECYGTEDSVSMQAGRSDAHCSPPGPLVYIIDTAQPE